MTVERVSENKAGIGDYVAIARPDHWLKNVFMLPGAALAYVIDEQAQLASLVTLLIGIASTCFIASANYTINEFLDGKFDRHHPTKSARPTAQGLIKLKYVVVQYILLAALGLGIAFFLNPMFYIASIALLVMGLIYNVEPIRTKDKVFLDVLSESINNPIRLLLGWAAISSIILPPSSILLSYWMGGAYLMAIKRYSEYRMIGDPERAANYRRSFKTYTEESLLLSAFFYALTSVFFLGIFLIKYRIEFILSFPFFALLFVWYLKIASQPASLAVNPEKMYRKPAFLAYVGFLGVLILALFLIDIPGIEYLTDHSVVNDVRVEPIDGEVTN